jgi:hypothetical protein
MLFFVTNVRTGLITPGKKDVQRFPQLLSEVIRLHSAQSRLFAVAGRLGSRLLSSFGRNDTCARYADRQT